MVFLENIFSPKRKNQFFPKVVQPAWRWDMFHTARFSKAMDSRQRWQAVRDKVKGFDLTPLISTIINFFLIFSKPNNFIKLSRKNFNCFIGSVIFCSPSTNSLDQEINLFFMSKFCY